MAARMGAAARSSMCLHVYFTFLCLFAYLSAVLCQAEYVSTRSELAKNLIYVQYANFWGLPGG